MTGGGREMGFTKNNAAAGAAGGEKGRILLINNDERFLETVANLLGGSYGLIIAKSGREALERLSCGPAPDLILLGAEMPGMNGCETLEKIQETGNAVCIPVVFLAGTAGSDKEELRGLELGAVDYIAKPFVKEILIKRLEIHIQQWKELRALYRERRGRKKPSPVPPLTPWEREIALLAQKRLSSAEIAGQMLTTGGTIRTALSSIYTKLDIHSKRELSGLDLENGG
jgi:DNA-binding NarL/FixJ family response regulator